ncbi:MAG: hypothetical protein U9N60_10800 [Thermodesulfobacteriota bacterium]|nr:hypothetical protein [Thermodesulfobacteriota bacterium]
MKKLTVILCSLLFLSGCAALEEAGYVDREFGLANRAAMDRQIAFPDKQVVAGQPPEGVPGINAERMMTSHNDGFGKSPKQTNVFKLEIAK